MYCMKLRRYGIPALLFVAVFVPALAAHAHVTGASWELKQDGYVVDVGYDPTTFDAGSYTRFDFNLKKESDSSQVDFAEVWVRIIKDKDTYLATGLRHEPIGPTTLLYVFPQAGSYTLEASFRTDDGTELTVASFPISATSDAGTSLSIVVFLLVGILVGIAAGYALFRFLSKKSSG